MMMLRSGRRTCVLTLSLLSTMAAASGSATAASKVKTTKYHVSGTMVVSSVVSQKGTPPAPGSSCVNAGTVTLSPWGKGTLRTSSTFDGAPAPGTFPLHGTGRFVFAKAELDFKFTMLSTWQDKSGIFSFGKATVTGGTGKLSHAKGSFSFEGSSPAGILQPATLTLTGTVTVSQSHKSATRA